MPITDTLKTAEEFRQVGFSDEQAGLLSVKLEETAQAQSEDLKQFIRSQFSLQGARIDARLEGLRADFQTSLRDQLLKFITIMVGLISLAVVVIKLFPNAT